MDLKRALLDPETARLAVLRLKQAKQVLGVVEGAVRAYAAQVGGIDMGDGTKWGPVAKVREEIAGDVAHEQVRAMAVQAGCGEVNAIDLADSTVTMDVTKKALHDAAKRIAKVSGQKIAPTERALLARIAEAGGVVEKVRTEYEVYPASSAKALPAATETTTTDAADEADVIT